MKGYEKVEEFFDKLNNAKFLNKELLQRRATIVGLAVAAIAGHAADPRYVIRRPPGGECRSGGIATERERLGRTRARRSSLTANAAHSHSGGCSGCRLDCAVFTNPESRAPDRSDGAAQQCCRRFCYP